MTHSADGLVSAEESKGRGSPLSGEPATSRGQGAARGCYQAAGRSAEDHGQPPSAAVCPLFYRFLVFIAASFRRNAVV